MIELIYINSDKDWIIYCIFIIIELEVVLVHTKVKNQHELDEVEVKLMGF